MDSNRWLGILTSQLWSLPYLVVLFVGMLLAVCLWRRHPMVSLMAFLGFGTLLANILVGVGLNIWFMSAESGVSLNRARLLNVLGIVRSIVSMLGHALLIIAIFGWRKPGLKK